MSEQNIVILGAGYAGLKAARTLNDYLGGSSKYQPVLINKHNFHMFMTKMHEHAAGTCEECDVMVPLDEVLEKTCIKFIKGWADDVDLNNKVVVVNHGEIKIPFKYLLVALGSEPDYYNIEGLEKYSVSLRSLYSAGKIRRRIERLLNQAAKMPPGEERRKLLTFIVGGGGLTGVEFAGELAYRLENSKELYGLNNSDYKIILVEAAQKLLPEMPADMGQYSKEALEEMGIKVLTGETVKKVTADTVYLSSGREIKYNTFLWTGGIRGNKMLAQSDFQTDVQGRVPVNGYLQYADNPHIYAAGGSAAVKDPRIGNPVVPSAQAALQQGELAAYNIYADITGKNKKIYRPVLLGTLIPVIRREDLGKIKTFKIKGSAAALLKNIIPTKYRFSLGRLKILKKNYIHKSEKNKLHHRPVV